MDANTNIAIRYETSFIKRKTKKKNYTHTVHALNNIFDIGLPKFGAMHINKPRIETRCNYVQQILQYFNNIFLKEKIYCTY